jgi:predicted ATPase/MoxR-like ATPase
MSDSLLIDQRRRWEQGELVLVEAYLEHEPGLRSETDQVLELIEHEIVLRQERGENPLLEDYLRRFPDLERDLRLHFEVRAALQSWPAPARAAQTQGSFVGQAPSLPGYELLREVGRGGMGVVYQARQVKLNRLVALKFLSAELSREAEAVERFQREALIVSALNDSHICTIYDLGDHQGQPFLVLEWIEGQTLRAFAGQRMSVAALAQVVRPVAQALRAAHAAGIVHRDIKPENVLVRADGQVKVLDFGVARLLPGSGRSVLPQAGKGTDPGTLVGTVRYMSPEQTRCEPASSASDVFALGILLYELATGRHPFEAEGTLALLHGIADQPPLPPSRWQPELAGPLEGLILQMLAKDPRRRPTAAEVEATLAELARGGPGLAATQQPPPGSRATVGRATELAHLHNGWQSAVAGQGLLLCVTGEPGIGKTTLVEAFVAELSERGPLPSVGRGRCSERLAGTEAYLPIVEALESLLLGDGGDTATRILKLVAPTWYVYVVPQVKDDSALQRLTREAQASSQERLKRELLAFLQELSRLRPVLLFLDDIHWADASTVDLLAYLGDRCPGLRVLVVLTYRPTELLLGPHPFLPVQRELQGRGVCREMALGFLDRADIDRYLTLTFPEHNFPADFAALLHARTEGNPLFLTDLVRYLRERGIVAQEQGRWVLAQAVPNLRQELPESVRGLIERKIGRLSEADRRVLTTASVQGYEFDAAVVARALLLEPAVVEEQLEVLADVHGLVRPLREQEVPDGTLTVRYRFVHVLYQNAFYDALRPARRVALSAAVAQTLAACYGEQSAVVAAELALLWEAARDWGRAAEFFGLAAQNALRVFAYQEAAVLARRGLDMVPRLPDTPARAQRELGLQMVLCVALRWSKGIAYAEMEQANTRARVLCQQLGDSVQLFSILWGIAAYHLVRAELQPSREIAEQMLRLAQSAGDSARIGQAHSLLGIICSHSDEPTAALHHFEEAIRLHDPQDVQDYLLVYGVDPEVFSRSCVAWPLWILGYPDRALGKAAEALARSRGLPHPLGQAHAMYYLTSLHQLRREARQSEEWAESLLRLCDEQEIALYDMFGRIWWGWALAAQGQRERGVTQMRQGLAAKRARTSQMLEGQALALLAEVLGEDGQIDEALAAVAEALTMAERTGERCYEAELHRLHGELLLRRPGSADATHAAAEACFRKALEVSRRHQAKSWELRAALSLSRLYQKQGKAAEARQMLADIYGWFTEGFDTADLQEAKALLASLA